LKVLVRAEADYQEEFLEAVVLEAAVVGHLERVGIEGIGEDMVPLEALEQPFAAVVVGHDGFEDVFVRALELLRSFLAIADGSTIGGVKGH